ncbi:MAG: aminodeoxychorismate synthase, component I, partial [Acidimicrobiia bacterium]|nr:aminodeoxychorismate synthase, component I [Acidimicrobiia bacterium]
TALYGTGGGVTIDSDPAGEYLESRWKIAILTHTADFSLLETMRSGADGKIYLLERHLDRLASSAKYFDISLDLESVRDPLATVGGPARVRLTVDRFGGVHVETSRLPTTLARPRVVLDDVPVDPSDPFLHHKTTNRAIYERAMARHPDADDVILINDDDLATETTMANLVVQLDGVWCTPPLDDGCLAGIERGLLLEEGKVEERSVRIRDLDQATGLARVNSLRGWEDVEFLSSPIS